MKFSALIAAVSAEWNGVSEDNSCGMVIQGENFVNKTCTITGSNIAHKFAGNGAFITGDNTFTGFDGISSDVDLIVFFDQDCSAGECDNSTCWDASVSCVNNGAASGGVYFMETVNDHRGETGGSFNIQIAGVQEGDTLTINLNNFACQNISAPFGIVTATADDWGNQYSDSGTFAVDVGRNFGDLFQISFTQQPGQTAALDLWKSSVTSSVIAS